MVRAERRWALGVITTRHAVDRREPNPFERIVSSRRRPHFAVEPAAVAWNAVAFRVWGEREAIACVPRAELTDFLDKLDAGALDEQINRFLESPPADRVLRVASQAERTGMFDEMASPGAIVPAERVPGRPRPFGFGRDGGSPVDARRRKRRGGRVPRLLVAVAVVVAVVATGAIAIASRSASKPPPPPPAEAAIGDTCVIGHWRLTGPMADIFTVDETGEVVPVTGGAGVRQTIDADGVSIIDWAGTGTFRGTLADGTALVYSLSGVQRARQTNRDGVERDSADDVSQVKLSGTLGGKPITNPHYRKPLPDSTSPYRCDATSYVIGTTNWTRG